MQKTILILALLVCGVSAANASFWSDLFSNNQYNNYPPYGQMPYNTYQNNYQMQYPQSPYQTSYGYGNTTGNTNVNTYGNGYNRYNRHNGYRNYMPTGQTIQPPTTYQNQTFGNMRSNALNTFFNQ